MFLRRKGKDPGAAITEFWVWWSGTRQRVATAIEDGTVGSLAGEISDRVAAIRKDLQWELNRGKKAQHSLVVAPAGDARLRATVARWLAVAPAADPVFEYYGSRQPDDEILTSRMQIAGHELDLSGIRFAFTVDEDAHEIDVAVFHPDFPAVPESARLQVTFLALDWALGGEEQVELWIGRVEPQLAPTPGLRTPEELRAAVADLAGKHAEPVYAILGGETPRGMPMMAMVQAPLKAARWPRFDTHVAVTLSFPAQDNGLPTDESLDKLRDVEDRVAAAMGQDGEVVAHETSGGIRTLHAYVDGAASAADTVATGIASSGELTGTTKVTYDPAFERVAHLRP